MEQTKQTPQKKAYDRKYREENLKRIPLDVQNSDYVNLKAAADSSGMKVNEYIKAAIREKMSRDGAAAKKAEAPDKSEAPA